MKPVISRRSFLGLGSTLAFCSLSSQNAVSASVQIPSESYKVFSRSDYTTSFYRIPYVLVSQKGSILAGADANRATTGDSADNIDAVIRRKPNASEHTLETGWSAPQGISPLEMQDFSPTSGYAQESASVIDGAIVQDTKSGRILLLIDAFAWNGGVFEHLNVSPDNSVHGGRARNMVLGDGFAEVSGRSMLLLSDENKKGNADEKTNNINLNIDRSAFNYVADLDGPRDTEGRIKIFHLVGTPQPYTTSGVNDKNLSLGEVSKFSLDSNFVLFENGEALQSVQNDTENKVPTRIFYKDSKLQIFNTNHILQVYSDDDGLSWNMDRIVTHEFRAPDSKNSLIAPGHTIQIQEGKHAGRILVPTYTQLSSGYEFIAMYSDDLGKSWHRSSPAPTSIPMHETAIIEVAPNILRSFHRHAADSGGKVLSAESFDGGLTWTTPTTAFGDDDSGVACQVSALKLKQKIKSPTTGEELTAIIVATAMDRSRKNGVIHLGLVHIDQDSRSNIEWIEQREVTNSDTPFAYSSLDQLPDGRVVLLYETSETTNWSDGLQNIYMKEFTF